MDISLNGYNEQIATFECDANLAKGDLVKITQNLKVAKADTDNDMFCGKAISVRNGFASIQLSGYMEATYSGTISLGFKTVAVDSSGNVKTVTTGGNKILIVNVDTVNNKIGFIL
jgi:hypothetical protein